MDVAADQSALANSKRLYVASIVALVVHSIAGISMALILRYGLDSAVDLSHRVAFLTEHRLLWTIGWLPWTAAAFSIFFFYYSFAKAHSDSNSRGVLFVRLVIVTAFIAVAFDLSAEYIEIFMLPSFAEKIRVQSSLIAPVIIQYFYYFNHLANILTGSFANALYTALAGLLIFRTRSTYNLLAHVAGTLLVISGAWLSIASLTNSFTGMVYSNIVLLPSLLVWLACVAMNCKKQLSLLAQ